MLNTSAQRVTTLPHGSYVCDNNFMLRLNLTLPAPAENIALDEALLEAAEERGGRDEFLRIWESPQPMVVAGRSTRISQEINRDQCEARRIPIVRRSSGGAAILAGPGCLMYAVVISYQKRSELRDISRAHRFVLGRIINALKPHLEGVGDVEHAGTSDLALSGRSPAASTRKFSGNSMRVKRTHFLYHGTLLYDLDLPLASHCLLMPPRQPEYRDRRQHLDFLTNLPLSRQQLTQAIDAAWVTTDELTDVPWHRVKELVATRFGQASWNFEFA